MPDKAKPDDPAQSQRFIDIAREVEAIDDLDLFDKTFLSISSCASKDTQIDLKLSKKGSAGHHPRLPKKHDSGK